MNDIVIAIEDNFLSLYNKLPDKIKKKLEKQLKHLKIDPRHPSLKIHKIENTDFWEFYIDIHYRGVFKKEDNIYKIYYVGTHRLIDNF